jgi:hypothetical protein
MRAKCGTRSDKKDEKGYLCNQHRNFGERKRRKLSV